MSEMLCTGTMLTCSFGLIPTPFNALPLPGMPQLTAVLPTATIVQIIPIDNIVPFGLCNSPDNPEVIAATAAALGAFTPMPCVPVPVAPWAPPSTVSVGDGIPLATVSSKCECAWGGVIQVDMPMVSPGNTE